MKFSLTDSEFYRTHHGVLPNAFIEDDVKVIRGDSLFQITFPVKYVLEGETFISDLQGSLMFNDTHRPTYILDENDEPVEVLEFIAGGGAYDKSRISDWGHPSVTRVKPFFIPESMWDKLEFAQNPLQQLAIDWVLENLEIDGHKLGDNFEPEQAGE